MYVLMLLDPTVRTGGYSGRGDFLCDPLGKVRRRPERQMAPFLYTGVQLVHPRVFEGTPEGPFSFNLVWDAVQESDRIYGVVHDGIWLDAGTTARERKRGGYGERVQARAGLGGRTVIKTQKKTK